MEYDALTKCHQALKVVVQTQEVRDFLLSNYPSVLERCDNAFNADNDCIPRAVINTILRAWPEQFAEILTDLKWSGDYYFITRWGMFVGIEVDGYIHT